jgi:hypothetical protein
LNSSNGLALFLVLVWQSSSQTTDLPSRRLGTSCSRFFENVVNGFAYIVACLAIRDSQNPARDQRIHPQQPRMRTTTATEPVDAAALSLNSVKFASGITCRAALG